MPERATDDFYASLPAFDRFAEVVEPRRYRPLPADWWLAVADVVDSTGAIAAGRYKAVNMVGASVISAVLNAANGRPFPFVFGGDGAALAIPPTLLDGTRVALAAVQVWAREEIGLTLRAALVPVAAVRAADRDVAVAKFQASPDMTYANFSGGGVAWADAEMKAGRLRIEPASPDSRPDLAGLSCRWTPITARHGEILSLIVIPRAGRGPSPAYAALVDDVLRLAAADGREGHPVPAEGPAFVWPPNGLEYEARASKGTGPLAREKRRILAISLLGWLLDRARMKLGRFDPLHYRATTARNTDFRKFDDGLKLTLDCSPATERALEERLARAHAEGVCCYGLHRQGQALMTCIVPSPLTNDHMHFVDGAAGGYAQAAAMLKKQLQPPA